MEEIEFEWPQKFVSFYKLVDANAKQIMNGTLLAIDPASGGTSMPGYAIFEQGVFSRSGTMNIPSKMPIHKRLAALHTYIQKLMLVAPDVLAIELIRGRNTHIYLHWAVGVSIAAASPAVLIEVPISMWKFVAKADADYEKGDEADAIKIGQAIILLTQEYVREHP